MKPAVWRLVKEPGCGAEQIVIVLPAKLYQALENNAEESLSESMWRKL
jgi:hypothetical protein